MDRAITDLRDKIKAVVPDPITFSLFVTDIAPFVSVYLDWHNALPGIQRPHVMHTVTASVPETDEYIVDRVKRAVAEMQDKVALLRAADAEAVRNSGNSDMWSINDWMVPDPQPDAVVEGLDGRLR